MLGGHQDNPFQRLHLSLVVGLVGIASVVDLEDNRHILAVVVVDNLVVGSFAVGIGAVRHRNTGLQTCLKRGEE